VYLIIWQFEVAPEKRPEFARRYASDGDWARLFARSVEWQGTELIAVEGDAGSFFTVDRWTSPGAWERFKGVHTADYDALDRKCDGLTLSERRIGAGVAL
jgi:hypothetical protein